MGIVTQETILFNDTVRNNIAYGENDNSHPSRSSKHRKQLMHINLFEIEKGYDTIIGDRGSKTFRR